MLPFHFTVPGPPVSHQTRNRQGLVDWKARVREAAVAVWPQWANPETGLVEVGITYYYESEAPDVDNIIKPIQDALCGVVYVDDRQVCHTSSRKRDIGATYRIRGIPAVLASAFVQGDEFIHVAVTQWTDPGDFG